MVEEIWQRCMLALADGDDEEVHRLRIFHASLTAIDDSEFISECCGEAA